MPSTFSSSAAPAVAKIRPRGAVLRVGAERPRARDQSTSPAATAPLDADTARLFVQAAVAGTRSTVEGLLKKLGPERACAAVASTADLTHADGRPLDLWLAPETQTALIAAIRARRADIVELLLPHSDVFRKPVASEPWVHALYEAAGVVGKHKDEEHHRDAMAVFMRVAERALGQDAQGGRANHGTEWANALATGAFHDLVDVAAIALSHADPAFVEPFGAMDACTPLMVAAARGSRDVAELLASTSHWDRWNRFDAFEVAVWRSQWAVAAVIARQEMSHAEREQCSAAEFCSRCALFCTTLEEARDEREGDWDDDDPDCDELAYTMAEWGAEAERAAIAAAAGVRRRKPQKGTRRSKQL